MATYGYVRVSTLKQAAEGESLDVQQRKITGYALQHGWNTPKLYRDEGVSGSVSLNERSAGAEMLEEVSSGDVIVASKLDRLFRSALDALLTVKMLEKRGVSLHLLDMGGDVTGSGTARLFFTMVSAFAEFERERIGERVRDVKQDQRRRGRYLGGTRPFGWDVGQDGELLARETETRAHSQVLDLHRSGMSLRQIARRLADGGVDMHYSTVRRLLARGNVA